ncbi:MAG: 50S ribosomal protein L23 [Candidatus Nomurabacteria bacterium]|jgi:large subunit ribosomal protein L23|nr:50S ribosomal protein L23 [Candidatus Nomurabacteria bacterium]
MLKTIKPILSEKCRLLAETRNTYMFDITGKTSKQEIAKIVAGEFKVKVLSVDTLSRKGKEARVSRGKNKYPLTIVRADRKIAFVKIEDGKKLPFFEQPEEAKKAEKLEKSDKKVAKKETK